MISRLYREFYNVIRRLVNYLDNFVYCFPTKQRKNFEYLLHEYIDKGVISVINYNFDNLKNETLCFVDSMRVSNSFVKYKFSPSQDKESIYASVYACLLYDMYGEIKKFSNVQKQEWIDYFDSFQSKKDGLWYDKNLINEYYNDSDWWGARHLAIHMIAAYTALDAKPKYKISYVEKYYNKNYLYLWLDKFDWNGFFDHDNDIDNKIMNIMVVIQYNRDYFDDEDAGIAILNLYNYLDSKINPDTGMWGECDVDNSYQLSRSVQFAYHLLMGYFYDGRKVLGSERIIELTLRTQNRLGGFGERLNSSACEDIDSIALLIHLIDKTDIDINNSLKKALVWVFSNQNDDGGFVFRRNEAMWYGHDIMTANINESHLFATWFRTLSLSKICIFLSFKHGYHINRTPAF